MKRKVIHRRVYNGCVVCRPWAEGREAEKLCGEDGERVTSDWAEVTCRSCLKHRGSER